MNRKHVLVLVVLGLFFLSGAGYCVVGTQAIDSTADVSVDSGTLNLQDRYIFTAARDITRYTKEVPDSVFENLKARLGLKEACANFTDKSNCKAVKDLRVPQEYLSYFKIKPGFYVKEFRGFEQVYSGTVSQINFSGHYDENSQEYYEFNMLLSDYHGDTWSGPKPYRVYILSASSTAINSVRSLSQNERIKVTGHKRLNDIKREIIAYYREKPERLTESHAAFIFEMTDKMLADVPAEIAKQPFWRMPVEYQLQLLEKYMHLEVWDIVLKNQQSVQIVSFGLEDTTRLCLMNDDKVSEFYNLHSHLDAIFLIEANLVLEVTGATDTGFTEIVMLENGAWKNSTIYLYDD